MSLFLPGLFIYLIFAIPHGSEITWCFSFSVWLTPCSLRRECPPGQQGGGGGKGLGLNTTDSPSLTESSWIYRCFLVCSCHVGPFPEAFRDLYAVLFSFTGSQVRGAPHVLGLEVNPQSGAVWPCTSVLHLDFWGPSQQEYSLYTSLFLTPFCFYCSRFEVSWPKFLS